MAIVIPWILNFCKILHYFEMVSSGHCGRLPKGCKDVALSFVERLGAADERTAPNVKP
jgi:hypothetical protein